MTALSLAAPAHYLSRTEVFAFYERACSMPVATVTIGEAVCHKRGALRMRDWLAVAKMLREAGKEVVLGTKPVIESAAELRMLASLAADASLVLEVNDVGLLSALPPGAPFVAGPSLNLYNDEALEALADLGARRWVAPYELDGATFAALQLAAGPRLESEIPTFGRIPLAFSTRCFTAFSHLRSKHDCGQCCLEHPDGQHATTLDGRALMVVNGPQTLSATVLNLCEQLAHFQAMKVARVRIDPPRGADAAAVVDVFHRALNGSLAPVDASRRLAALVRAPFCNGYWFGKAGATLAA